MHMKRAVSMSKTKSKHQVVKSAARALDILELLVKFPSGLTLTDVADHLHIPFSSLHNLMSTLQERGYLTRDDGTSVYHLSSKLIQLAAAHHSQHDLVSIADPVMERVSRLTAETTSLAVRQDSAVVFIHKRAAQDFVQVVNPVGARVAAHATGLGKVMLADLDEIELDRLYPSEQLLRLTPATITTKRELKEALRRVREDGYAIDNAESHEGVWAVAAPLRNAKGRSVAALSVAAPLFRVKDTNRTDWREIVKDGAEEISRTLGFFA